MTARPLLSLGQHDHFHCHRHHRSLPGAPLTQSSVLTRFPIRMYVSLSAAPTSPSAPTSRWRRQICFSCGFEYGWVWAIRHLQNPQGKSSLFAERVVTLNSLDGISNRYNNHHSDELSWAKWKVEWAPWRNPDFEPQNLTKKFVDSFLGAFSTKKLFC